MQVRNYVGFKIEPWVDRYLEMVAKRYAMTGVRPMMDVVYAVCMRGIKLTSSNTGVPYGRT